MEPTPIMAAVQLALGISQAQLASLIGVDVRTLRRWREGRTRASGPGWILLSVLSEKLPSEAIQAEARRALTDRDPLRALLTSLLARV